MIFSHRNETRENTSGSGEVASNTTKIFLSTADRENPRRDTLSRRDPRRISWHFLSGPWRAPPFLDRWTMIFLASPLVAENELKSHEFLNVSKRKEEEGPPTVRYFRCVCAFTAKCQAQIKEKSPSGISYSSHAHIPLLRLVFLFHRCSGLSLFLARVPPRLSFHPCKQSNSKLPVVALRADHTDHDHDTARVSSNDRRRRVVPRVQATFLLLRRRNDGAAPSNRKGSVLGQRGNAS